VKNSRFEFHGRGDVVVRLGFLRCVVGNIHLIFYTAPGVYLESLATSRSR
jgi:hypothetical protein